MAKSVGSSASSFSYVELFEKVLSGQKVTISVPDSVEAERLRHRMSSFRHLLCSRRLDNVVVPEGRNVLDYKLIALSLQPGCVVLYKKQVRCVVPFDDVKFS